MIWVGHYHGPSKNFEELTGYSHSQEVNEPLLSIVNNIFKVGLNVMIKHGVNDSVIVWMANGNFHQR